VAYKDPEQQRAYAREWMRRHPEKAREAMRRWRETHRELSRERNRVQKRARYARDPEGQKARIAAYYAEHPEALRAKDHRYRARRREAEGHFTAIEWRSSSRNSAAFAVTAPLRDRFRPIIAFRCVAAARISSRTSFLRVPAAINEREARPKRNSARDSPGSRFSDRLNSRIECLEAG